LNDRRAAAEIVEREYGRRVAVPVASSRCQPDKYAHDKHPAIVDAVTFKAV
jgi:hypothetical protein